MFERMEDLILSSLLGLHVGLSLNSFTGKDDACLHLSEIFSKRVINNDKLTIFEYKLERQAFRFLKIVVGV